MRNNKIIIAGILLILGSTFVNAKSVEFYEKNIKEAHKRLDANIDTVCYRPNASKEAKQDCENAKKAIENERIKNLPKEQVLFGVKVKVDPEMQRSLRNF